jgi:hypothetical protein
MVVVGIIACLLLAAIYNQRRDLSVGLLIGLVALVVRTKQRAPNRDTQITKPDPRIAVELPRTSEKINEAIQKDDRSPDQLASALEREFGPSTGDGL